MDDRAAGAAPGGQQSQSLRLHARIVAPAPGRVVEGPLDVDGKQDRVIAQHEGASSRYSRSASGAVVRGRLRLMMATPMMVMMQPAMRLRVIGSASRRNRACQYAEDPVGVVPSIKISMS